MTIVHSPCYQIFKKYLKKICIKGCIPSSVTIILSITYSFGFRQRYSTSHALIDIIENIRKALDDRNIGCKVFVDLQKAFDTVDHQILLAKLNPCRICGVLNIDLDSNRLIEISMHL